MDCCMTLCPQCKINVGFLVCCSCHQAFVFEETDGLKVPCPLCINQQLITYYQPDEDVNIHEGCWKNSKRMYYGCSCCNMHFCRCVEQQLKKKFNLKACPTRISVQTQ